MANLKHIILGIAIALISVFFFVYAVQAVYPSIEYEDFCEEDFYKLNIESESECDAINGRWTGGSDEVPKIVSPNGGIDEPRIISTPENGNCDINYYCRQEYQDARESYERNVFFVNLIIGVVVLIGAFFLAVEAVSTGLMGGAVMLIVYATIRYWGNLSDVWRTVVLGLSLTLLIGLAYKKLRDQSSL